MSFRISKKDLLEVEADSDFLDNEDEINRGWFRTLLMYITLSPSDLQLVLNERIETIDWDSKSSSVARPVGIFFTALVYVLRLLQDNMIKPNYFKVQKQENAFDLSKSETLRQFDFLAQYSNGANFNSKITVKWKYYLFLQTFDKFINFINYTILLGCVWTSYKFLFSEFKRYSLFGWKKTRDSPNLTKKALDDLSKSFYEDISKKSFWSMLNFFIFQKEKKAILDNELNEKFFYQLNKWNPSKFITHLFVSLNPFNLMILVMFDVSFFTALLLVFTHQILHFVIIKRYETRLLDESIISSATIDEINSKIIKPRTIPQIQDVMVDATDIHRSFVEFFPAVVHTPIFKTHSLNGDLIKERYNKKIHEFEDLTETNPPHNVVSKNAFDLYRT